MNDLISKAKALKAIEAAARLCVADANHNYLMGFQDAAEAVAQVEAEAMTEQHEIVRCRECYWWTRQEDSLQGRCALMQSYPTGEWYCGNAREKGEE